MKTEEENSHKIIIKLVVVFLIIFLIISNLWIHSKTQDKDGVLVNYIIEFNSTIFIFLLLFFVIHWIGDIRKFFFPNDKDNIAHINESVEKIFQLTTENHKLLKDDLNTLLENEQEQSKLLKEKHEMFFQYHFNKPDRSDTLGQIFNHYLTLENNTLHYIAFHNKEGCLEEDTYHTALVEEIKKYEKEGSQNSKEEQLKAYREFALNYDKLISVIELKLENLGQGGLIKIALDVKIGGIFYYIYDDPNRNKETEKIEYIFGATLNQKAMDNASAYKQMQEIFDEVNKNIRKK